MSSTGTFPICPQSLSVSEEWHASLPAASRSLLETLQHPPALSRELVLVSWAAGCMGQPPLCGWGGERTLWWGSLPLQTPVCTVLHISGLLPFFLLPGIKPFGKLVVNILRTFSSANRNRRALPPKRLKKNKIEIHLNKQKKWLNCHA